MEVNGGTAAYHRRYREVRKKRRARDDGQGPAQQLNNGETQPADIASMSTALAVPERATTAKSDESKTEAGSANSDGFSSEIRMKSGRFKLVPLGDANSDALFVEIEFISRA